MGIITSRFREKQTTVEILEKIDKDIAALQRDRRSNQELQKRIAASLILYSILLYIVLAIVFYFFYFPDNWPDRALYSSPFLVFPFLIWAARKLMHWYFVKRLAANDFALTELREKRKLILEEVMEKETYKKAREILEKFDPGRFKKLEKPPSPQNPTPTPGTVMRQRGTPQQRSPPVMATPRGPPMPQAMTPMTGPRPAAGPATSPRMAMATPRPGGPIPMRYSPPPGPPMPRTIISRDRGSMEKVIDYLVGDGPQNRYALICKFCHSHNGMALPEEFEFLSFRCCYCYNMNQARKMRPFAPRLEFPEVPPQARAAAGGVSQAPGEKSATSEDASDDEEEEDVNSEGSLEKDADGERGDDTRNATGELSATRVSSSKSLADGQGPQRSPKAVSAAAQQKGTVPTNGAPQKAVPSAQAAKQQASVSQDAAAAQQSRVPAASTSAHQQVASQARSNSQQAGELQADPAQRRSHSDAASASTVDPSSSASSVKSSTSGESAADASVNGKPESEQS